MGIESAALRCEPMRELAGGGAKRRSALGGPGWRTRSSDDERLCRRCLVSASRWAQLRPARDDEHAQGPGKVGRASWFVEPVDGARKFRGDDVEDTVESSVAQFLKGEGY